MSYSYKPSTILTCLGLAISIQSKLAQNLHLTVEVQATLD